MYLQHFRASKENESLFPPGWKPFSLVGEVGHLPVWEMGRVKEGRRQQRSVWAELDIWRGQVVSQQLFPVFISFFQPLAFWWDVRGGAFVCMGCRGCLGHESSGVWPGIQDYWSSIPDHFCAIDDSSVWRQKMYFAWRYFPSTVIAFF